VMTVSTDQGLKDTRKDALISATNTCTHQHQRSAFQAHFISRCAV
jgi:hypothetical protein